MSLKDTTSKINKMFGSGSIQEFGSHEQSEIASISSGILSLDLLTGCGGIPMGRIVEAYGSECLDENTFIPYHVNVEGRRSNHKGGTIQRLHERFHGLKPEGDGRGKFKRNRLKGLPMMYTVACVNELNRIVHNEIEDVVFSGEKDCFQVSTENGYSISTSVKHQFLTKDGYKELQYLSVGDVIFVHNNTPFTGRKEKVNRPDVLVKHHPTAREKTVTPVNERTKNVRSYTYKRIQRSRLVKEAAINNLSFKQYVERLNAGNLERLKFLSTDVHVHHLNENGLDDRPENLVILDPSEHNRFHALKEHNNLRFVAVEDKIGSIIYIGKRKTYDIKMKGPYHNFIADNFVVHNSGGKTTLALTIAAQVQKAGKIAAFIDAEHSLSPQYAADLGVDINKLLISQPDYGEQGLQIAEELIKSGDVGIVIIDSIASLIPKNELDGDITDNHMGLAGRMMSAAMRRLTGVTHKSQTILFCLNQLREKIGVMFGSPETQPGGRALKFYSSIRMDIRRTATLKDGDVNYGARTKIKLVKNKMGSPFQETEVDLIFGKGFSRAGDIFDLAKQRSLIEGSGAWVTIYGERLQGRANAITYLEENKEVADKLEAEIRKAI